MMLFLRISFRLFVPQNDSGIGCINDACYNYDEHIPHVRHFPFGSSRKLPIEINWEGTSSSLKVSTDNLSHTQKSYMRCHLSTSWTTVVNAWANNWPCTCLAYAYKTILNFYEITTFSCHLIVRKQAFKEHDRCSSYLKMCGRDKCTKWTIGHMDIS